MSPEPQDILTLHERRNLEAFRDTLLTRGTEQIALHPYRGVETFERIARAHAIAVDAQEREMLRVDRLPMEGRNNEALVRTVRAASRHLTPEQHAQWARWRGNGGDLRRNTLGLVIAWRVPPAWERAMSDTQLEQTTHTWLLPLLASGLWVPQACFSEPLVSWVIEPDRGAQGITFALLRED